MLLGHALIFSFLILFPDVAHHLGTQQSYVETASVGNKTWNSWKQNSSITQSQNAASNSPKTAGRTKQRRGVLPECKFLGGAHGMKAIVVFIIIIILRECLFAGK